jgi:hypothetical protein
MSREDRPDRRAQRSSSRTRRQGQACAMFERGQLDSLDHEVALGVHGLFQHFIDCSIRYTP